MISKLPETIAKMRRKEIDALVALMKIVASDEAYIELVNAKLSKSFGYENRRLLLEIGHFSGQDFLSLLNSAGGGVGVNIPVAQSLLTRLQEWLLVSDVAGLLDGAFARYQWHKVRIKQFLDLEILENVLHGPAYIVEKYQKSVPAIFVNKDGEKRTGSGFLTSNFPGSTRRFVVTARHNVDPNEGIAFEAFGLPEGVRYRALSLAWLLHPDLDIAVMPVECSPDIVPLYLFGTASVLSRTISLGYPRIATTDRPYLLAHGGELNAIVESYLGGTLLIISNAVTPGNSGGPVIDEAGLCVGMVIVALETAHEGGVSAVSAAISSNALLEFVEWVAREYE